MKNYLLILLIIISGCSEETQPVPVATAATSINADGFTANWHSLEGAQGYELDVSTDIDFSTLIVAGTTDVNSANIGGTESVTEYFYRVRAIFNGQNLSGNSNVISLITLPEAPVAIVATNRTSDGFTVNWIEVQGITNYLLFISEDSFASDPPVYVSGYGGKEVSGTSHVVTGLESSSIYYFALKSKLDEAISTYSNTIFVVTTN